MAKIQFNLQFDYTPDLILLDLSLAGYTRKWSNKTVTCRAENSGYTVIILSAYAMSRQIEILLVAGAKDYLMKPIDVVQFLKLVDERIRKKQ